MNIKRSCCLVILLSSFNASADLRIEATDQNGQQIIFSSNDQFVRMDVQREQKYALIDLQRQAFMLVSPQQREVLVLDNSNIDGRAGVALEIKLEPAGDGPAIAGYSTRKYLLLANNKKCAVIYGSKQAAQQPGMQKLFSALEQLQQRITAMMNGATPLIDVCSRAKSHTMQTFSTTGTPLRIDSADGKTQTRISRIDNHAQIPATAWKIPPAFKVTYMKDLMQQIEQQKQQMRQQLQRQMPDMQKMIEQLKRDGKMPEKAMEQLRKMKELLKQREPQ